MCMGYRIRAPWILGHLFFLDTMLDYISQASLQLDVAMWLQSGWWTEVMCATTRPTQQKILQTILHALSLMTWGLGDVRSLGPWIIIWKRVLCQSETPICILCEWETCFLLCLNNYTHIFWGLLVTAAGVIFNNDSIRASALTSYVTSAGYLTSQDPTSKIAIQ